MAVESASSTVLSPTGDLLYIGTDPHAGRTYHASSAISENSDLLGVCLPYTSMIWKRFRNEACAECWRYDRGRRAFLTRRDDDGISNNFRGDCNGDKKGEGKMPNWIGAGLWFCDEQCQGAWIFREGLGSMELFRMLEGARCKKDKGKPKDTATLVQGNRPDLTQEAIERAWDEVRRKETIPKEVKKWRNIQLDDFETDMARYVLLALVHLHQEQKPQGHAARSESASRTEIPRCRGGSIDRRQSDWCTFSSLQSNELQYVKACPEVLDNQIRIYQALKGRLGFVEAVKSVVKQEGCMSGPERTTEEARITQQNGQQYYRGAGQKEYGRRQGEKSEFWDLGRVITIANVRIALGVDPGNSFGIWEMPLIEESECLGFAVYPEASFFNHHCSPNVRKLRDGRGLRFVTTKSVGVEEELCISYGHVEGMSWQERQKELQEGWYFSCRCGRCVDEMTS